MKMQKCSVCDYTVCFEDASYYSIKRPSYKNTIVYEFDTSEYVKINPKLGRRISYEEDQKLKNNKIILEKTIENFIEAFSKINRSKDHKEAKLIALKTLEKLLY